VVTFLHGGSPFKVSQPDSFRIRLDRRSTFNYSRDILPRAAIDCSFPVKGVKPRANANENATAETNPLSTLPKSRPAFAATAG
jgi:hypothetical protein